MIVRPRSRTSKVPRGVFTYSTLASRRSSRSPAWNANKLKQISAPKQALFVPRQIRPTEIFSRTRTKITGDIFRRFFRPKDRAVSLFRGFCDRLGDVSWIGQGKTFTSRIQEALSTR